MPNLKDDWLNWKSAKINFYTGVTISWPKICLCCGKQDATAHQVRYEGSKPKTQWLSVWSFYCDFCWHHVELAKRPEPRSWRDASGIFGAVLWLALLSSFFLFFAVHKALLAGALPVGVSACWWLASRTSWYRRNAAAWRQIKQQKILEREGEVLASLGPNCTAKADAMKAVWPYTGIDLHFANDYYCEAFLKANEGKRVLRS